MANSELSAADIQHLLDDIIDRNQEEGDADTVTSGPEVPRAARLGAMYGMGTERFREALAGVGVTAQQAADAMRAVGEQLREFGQRSGEVNVFHGANRAGRSVISGVGHINPTRFEIPRNSEAEIRFLGTDLSMPQYQLNGIEQRIPVQAAEDMARDIDAMTLQNLMMGGNSPHGVDDIVMKVQKNRHTPVTVVLGDGYAGAIRKYISRRHK